MSSALAKGQLQAKEVSVHEWLDQKQAYDGPHISQCHPPAGDPADISGTAYLGKKCIVKNQSALISTPAEPAMDEISIVDALLDFKGDYSSDYESFSLKKIKKKALYRIEKEEW